MKKDSVRFLGCILFFIVLAAITFRCTWPANHVFSASDMSIGRLSIVKNLLPESFTGVYHAGPVFGSSGYSINLFKILVSLLPLSFVANAFYGIMLVLGSMSLVWFLRIWDRSWIAAVFGALVGFWFNSVMLSAAGHVYKIEVLGFSVLSLCFVEKAVRASSAKQCAGYGVFAGISVGVMMLEQQDVALLAGLFLGAYSLFRLIREHGKYLIRWLSLLVPIAVVALLISGNMVFKSYERNITGAASVQSGKDNKWDYVTQWSMVPSEWPDLIASGWSGWGTNDPEAPYWGRIGQSAEWGRTKQGFRNFKITSVYFGIIAFLLGGFGMVCAILKRKEKGGSVVLFWSVAGLVGLWLAFGKYSLLYKFFFQLPLVNNIRAPMKFLDNFQICLGIAGAYGLDRLLAFGKETKGARCLWIAGVACAGLMLMAGLRYLLAPAGKIQAFKEAGYANHAEAMVANMSNAWLHAALLAFICGALVFVVWKGLKAAKWAGFVFVAVLAVDSVILTSHYFEANNIASLKKGNVVTNFLKQNQGTERIFFVDQSGIYNQWLASDVPYHQLNVFNFWQMPRMPVLYKNFLGSVGRNQIRLWELAAVKYVVAPASILQQMRQNPQLAGRFVPVLNYKVPTAQGLRDDVILEFRGAIPRFAFYTGWDVQPLDRHCELLTDPGRNVHSSVLLTPEAGLSPQSATQPFKSLTGEVSKNSVVVNVEAEQAGILRFSQKYQPNIEVLVNDEPADLIRIDYLCMGVMLPEGSHSVEFRPADGKSNAVTMAAAFLISLISGTVLIRPDRRDQS